MKKISILFVLAVLFVTAAAANPYPHTGRIIVKIRENASETVMRDHFSPSSSSRSAQFGGIPIKKIKSLIPDEIAERISSRNMTDYKPGLYLVEPEKTGDLHMKKALMMLRNNRDVEYAEPDYIVSIGTTRPSDPDINELWGMEQIQALEAWDIRTGAEDIVVAVIDTGVDFNHPDLEDNMIDGFDFENNDANPMDDNRHGTHCAGTIGAVGNNNVGVAGVAWNVRIMPLKFLDSTGSGSTADAILCIDFAIANGAHIMSNSWGGGGFNQALFDAIERAREADILFIAAAGNDSADNDRDLYYPASYDLDNIIAVASTNENDDLSNFSNFGATTVDIAAPGSNIFSTTPNDGYTVLSGTSMATPHVAGAAALIKAVNPKWDYEKIRDFLFDTVDTLTDLNGVVATGGRLNVFNALKAAQSEYVSTIIGPIINLILED